MTTKSAVASQKFTVKVYLTGLPPSGHDIRLIHTATVSASSLQEAGALVLAAFPLSNIMLRVDPAEEGSTAHNDGDQNLRG